MSKAIASVMALLAIYPSCLCGTPEAHSSLIKEAQNVSKIVIRKSLTKTQAESIILLYWDYHIHPNCMPTEVLDGGKYWFTIPNTGDNCEPDKNKIRVEKNSGAISWGNAPKYNSYKALAIEVSNHPKGPAITK